MRNERESCSYEEGVSPTEAWRGNSDDSHLMERLERVESTLQHISSRLGLEDTTNAMCDTRPSSVAPALAPAGDPPRYNLFGLSMQRTSDDALRSGLLHVRQYMPDERVVERFCYAFETRMHWISAVLDISALRHHITRVRELDAYAKGDKQLSALTADGLRSYIYSMLLVYSAFGLTLVNSQCSAVAAFYNDDAEASLNGVFFHAALYGLSLMNLFEEPTMEACKVIFLLASGVCATRPQVVGTGFLQTAVQMAVRLRLDAEPEPSMPMEVARERVEFYAMLCIYDWFTLSTVKRQAAIAEDPPRLPSVFGSTTSRRRLLSEATIEQLDIARLHRKAAQFIAEGAQDYERVCMISDELAQARDTWAQRALPANAPSGDGISGKNMRFRLITASLDFLLLKLHLGFYQRGWEDARFRHSRDTCYSSARGLLHLYGSAFVESGNSVQPTVFARVWKLCHWATSAAVLLLKHLSMLRAHAAQADSPQFREIAETLQHTTRYFERIAPSLPIARDGLVELQRAAADVLRGMSAPVGGSETQNFDHDPLTVLTRIVRDSEFVQADKTRVAAPTDAVAQLCAPYFAGSREQTVSTDGSAASADFPVSLDDPAGNMGMLSTPSADITVDGLDTFWNVADSLRSDIPSTNDLSNLLDAQNAAAQDFINAADFARSGPPSDSPRPFPLPLETLEPFANAIQLSLDQASKEVPQDGQMS